MRFKICNKKTQYEDVWFIMVKYKYWPFWVYFRSSVLDGRDILKFNNEIHAKYYIESIKQELIERKKYLLNEKKKKLALKRVKMTCEEIK